MRKTIPICHPNRAYAARGMCSPCYRKHLYWTDPEYRKRKQLCNQDWNRRNRENRANVRAEYLYGASRTLYKELLERQSGKCAICLKPPGKKRFDIDHCHKTGEIRGLLCNPCNRYLGWYENHKEAANRYLDNQPSHMVKRGVMKDQFVFYVAGPWALREQVRAEIAKINAAGWKTCSRWAEPDNPDVDPDDPERDAKLRFQALRDVEDVIKADGLIYINSKKSEGKATELGMSIATLKPIIIIGNRENNIFLNLNIPAYPTVEAALEWLEGEGQIYLNWVLTRQMMHLAATTRLFDDEDMGNVEFPSE